MPETVGYMQKGDIEAMKLAKELEAAKLDEAVRQFQGQTIPEPAGLRDELSGALDAVEGLSYQLGYTKEVTPLFDEARQLLSDKWETLFAATESAYAVVSIVWQTVRCLTEYTVAIRKNVGLNSLD